MRSLAGSIVGACALFVVGCSGGSSGAADVHAARGDDAGELAEDDAGALGDAAGASADAGGELGDGGELADGGTPLGSGDSAPPSSGTATTTGSLFGQTFGTSSALAMVAASATSNIWISVANAPIGCGNLSEGVPPPSDAMLTLVVNAGPDGGAIAPGTYQVGGTTFPTGSLMFVDRPDTCDVNTASNGYTSSGTITISAIDAGSVQGSFNVTVGDAGTMAGTFDTTVCAPGAAYDAACP